MSTQYEEPAAERAVYQARRVRALLAGLENSLGQARIGSFEFDSTVRNLVEVAREEMATLSKVLGDT